MAFWLPLVFMLGNEGAWCVLVSTSGGSHPQDLQPIIADPAAYSNDWALQVEGGDEAADVLARFTGFINMGQIGNLEGYYHFQFNATLHGNATLVASRSIGSLSQMPRSPDLTTTLQQHQNVGYVQQQRIFKRVLKDYTPPNDPSWRKQWSLLNTGLITHGSQGKDLNVEPAWMQGITGSGIIVGVVDNGLETSHLDLQPNYDSLASYDYAHHDHNPTPDQYYGEDPDSHGTMCAGVIAMAKSNRRCGVGVAHNAHVGGIKFDLSSGSDLIEALSLGYKNNYIHIYSNSWGPLDKGFVVSGPGHLAKRTMERGIAQGRQGKGSIYVWAAGNGGGYHDSCSTDGYSSSVYTISMGSANYDGRQAFYDENCPSKMAVTFSYNSRTFPGRYSDWDPYNQVSTTSLNGACVSGFTGTSASAPLLSGTIALVLEANPLLTWRDVQYLVAYTSTQDKLVGGNWLTNGAGLKVSQKFGFGALDAEAMVTRARRWVNVPTQYSANIRVNSIRTARHYRDIDITLRVTSSQANRISFLEHVVLDTTLEIRSYGIGYGYSDYTYHMRIDPHHILEWLARPHPKRGDIQITLTSPQGTTSTLLPYRLYDFVNEEGFDNWPFMSVHHWGESPVGSWRLRISFKSASGYVSMTSLQLKLYGTRATPLSVSRIPARCDPACRAGTRCSGSGSQNCDVCRAKRVASTQECVSSCPPGTHSFKKYCLGTPRVPPPPTMPPVASSSSTTQHSVWDTKPTTQVRPATTSIPTRSSWNTNPITAATTTPQKLDSTTATDLTQTSHTATNHVSDTTTSAAVRLPLASSELLNTTLSTSSAGSNPGKAGGSSTGSVGVIAGSTVAGVILLSVTAIASALLLVKVLRRMRTARGAMQEVRFKRLEFENDDEPLLDEPSFSIVPPSGPGPGSGAGAPPPTSHRIAQGMSFRHKVIAIPV